MLDIIKAFTKIYESVDFLHKHGGEVHIKPYTLAGELGVSHECVREALKRFASSGFISMSTWRWEVFREVNYNEWPTTEFFYNRHDANYIRLRLAPRN